MATITREQFVQQVLGVFHKRYPLAKVARADEPFSIRINSHSASLENLYRSVVLQPEQLTSLVEQWALETMRVGEGRPELEAPFEELAERILPVVMPEHAIEVAGAAMVRQPLVAGLEIGYVVDSEESLWHIAEPLLDKWNVSPEKLHEQAMENLVARSQAISAHAAGDPQGEINLILFQTMDGFDASRILLPTLHSRLREHLGSPFVAGIPNRDILICFRDDPETVERVKEQIDNDYRKMPHPVSDRLILVTADGLAQRFETAED